MVKYYVFAIFTVLTAKIFARSKSARLTGKTSVLRSHKNDVKVAE